MTTKHDASTCTGMQRSLRAALFTALAVLCALGLLRSRTAALAGDSDSTAPNPVTYDLPSRLAGNVNTQQGTHA